MGKNRIWSRLSLAFHMAFWGTALVWLGVAGEAGSPLPDNWQKLLFWSHMAEWTALLTLTASIICAVISRWRESRIPISGIVSFVVLVITAHHWISLLSDSNF